MEHATADQRTSPRIRFSLVSLLLTTAVIAVSISHIQTSRRLAVTQSALTTAQNELGVLTIEDVNDVHAIALPSPGGMQWRWRIQLPKGPTFRLRWAVSDAIPESGLPQLPDQLDGSNVDGFAFLDVRGKPLPSGEPFIVNLSIARDEFGDWKLTCSYPRRSTSHTIDAPPVWLTKRGRGVTAEIAGRGKTEYLAPSQPFILLRYRKPTTTPTGRMTVDMNPTDGIIVWIEAAD